MRSHDLVEWFGAAAVTVGVALEAGAGWAAIVGGSLLVVGAQLRGAAAALTTPAVEDDES